MTDTAVSAASAPSVSWPGRRKLFLRRVLLGFAALLTAVMVLAAITIGPLLLEPNAYKGVQSIETRSDYRDANLIRRAWSLPVAREYRRGGFEYQSNPSFCGPASLANMLRSTGVRTDQEKVVDGTRFDPWSGILIAG